MDSFDLVSESQATILGHITWLPGSLKKASRVGLQLSILQIIYRIQKVFSQKNEKVALLYTDHLTNAQGSPSGGPQELFFRWSA